MKADIFFHPIEVVEAEIVYWEVAKMARVLAKKSSIKKSEICNS